MPYAHDALTGKDGPRQRRSFGYEMRKPGGQNLTYAIVEELGHAVVTGAYGDGDPFPIEAELCKQFGASRTVQQKPKRRATASRSVRALRSA